LSSSNKAIDLVKLVLSPDLHGSPYLGMNIDETKMPEKLGDALHSEFVVKVMRGIDGSLLCLLPV
jgi:hypothetical protein